MSRVLFPATAGLLVQLAIAHMYFPSAATAQGPAGAPSALLARVASYLESHGKAASVSEHISTYNTTFSPRGECVGRLRTVSNFDNREETSEYDLHLAELSPEIEMDPWTTGPLVSVFLRTTSGASAIPQTAERGRTIARVTEKLAFVMTDRPTADTVSALFSEAIKACGGRPRAADVVAAADARESAARQNLAELTGANLSAEQRQGILAACQTAVRARLRAPSTARFAEEITVYANPKSSGWMILGSVEAQNAMGAILNSKYMCSVEPFGKQYVPKSVLVY